MDPFTPFWTSKDTTTSIYCSLALVLQFLFWFRIKEVILQSTWRSANIPGFCWLKKSSVVSQPSEIAAGSFTNQTSQMCYLWVPGAKRQTLQQHALGPLSALSIAHHPSVFKYFTSFISWNQRLHKSRKDKILKVSQNISVRRELKKSEGDSKDRRGISWERVNCMKPQRSVYTSCVSPHAHSSLEKKVLRFRTV